MSFKNILTKMETGTESVNHKTVIKTLQEINLPHLHAQIQSLIS